MKFALKVSALLLTTLLLAGCFTSPPAAQDKLIHGESIVLIGEQPAKLAFPPFRLKTVRVRSHYKSDAAQAIHFEEGRDFVIDAKQGTIVRTAKSRIPDFRTNNLYGVEDFNHGNFPGFGNGKFFAYVDYQPRSKVAWPTQESQVAFLPKTQAKLSQGKKVKIVAFGDSITAGGDATTPDLIFWQRWADFLKSKHPTAQVEAINGATGGDRTQEGLHRLQEKVLNLKPDLVLVGFGMNDHNIGGFGVPLEQFSANLKTLIDRIRKETGAEIILYSTFPPNPKWHFGSHNMEAYAAATERVARENNCAFADIYRNWCSISSKKKPEDLLGNNINHPNDFGHWMYFKVLLELGL